MSRIIQTKDVHETDHYEMVKTIIEVYKSSGVAFSLISTQKIDMVISSLHTEGTISKGGKVKDGVYFELTKDEREAVNTKAEIMCIST